MHTVRILEHLVANYQVLVYLFIFLGLIVEGEFILISIGILLHLGGLNLFDTLFFIVLGLITKTMLGYYIGNVVHRAWGSTKFMKYIEKRVLKLMPKFKQKPFWSIFISKFIMGVNNIVIIFAGYQKVNFGKYLEAEFYSTILWAPTLVALGYLFSVTAIAVSHEIWRFSFIVLLLVVAFIAIDKLISWAYELVEEYYYGN